ncbi:hypothetical protein EON82_05945 [bacterium]|nr:MAG: hypothetical protein EON82_05945 [bacterium]
MHPLPQWTYDTIHIKGWTIKAEAALVRSAGWKSVAAELENQLYRVARVVPDGPLQKLRQVTIWVRRNDPSTACMAYHPGADWLKEHGTDPAMAKGVEIGNAANFVSWTYEQPWMLLHELAHAYHDRFLDKGFDNPEVKSAFEAGAASKKYEKVMHWNGGQERHYALNNPMEFFAEASEAYFGQNDFFPFVNAELRSFDPDTYTLLVRLWGPPQKRL